MNKGLWLAAGGGTIVLTIVIAMFMFRQQPSNTPTRPYVLLPDRVDAESFEQAASLDIAAVDVRPSGTTIEIESKILRDAFDPDAKLRGVKVTGDRQQIACGEILGAHARKYTRFIWLADAGKVVAKDTGGMYEQLAPLCSGMSLP